MAWEALKSAVSAVITDNGNNEITGPILEQLLNNNIIEQLGSDRFMGVANPSTSPGTPEREVYYFARELGVYANFGGINIVKDGFFVLIWKNSAWQLHTIYQQSESVDETGLAFMDVIVRYLERETGRNKNILETNGSVVKKVDNTDYTNGVFIRESLGTTDTNNQYRIKTIAVSSLGDNVKVTLDTVGTAIAGVAYYKSSTLTQENYLGYEIDGTTSSNILKDVPISIPSDATHIVVTSINTTDIVVTSEIFDVSKELNRLFDGSVEESPVLGDYYFVAGSFVDKSTKTLSGNGDYEYRILKLKGKKDIIASFGKEGSSVAVVSYYDSETISESSHIYTEIDGGIDEQVTDYVINPPVNAVIVVISSKNTYDNNISYTEVNFVDKTARNTVVQDSNTKKLSNNSVLKYDIYQSAYQTGVFLRLATRALDSNGSYYVKEIPVSDLGSNVRVTLNSEGNGIAGVAYYTSSVISADTFISHEIDGAVGSNIIKDYVLNIPQNAQYVVISSKNDTDIVVKHDVLCLEDERYEDLQTTILAQVEVPVNYTDSAYFRAETKVITSLSGYRYAVVDLKRLSNILVDFGTEGSAVARIAYFKTDNNTFNSATWLYTQEYTGAADQQVTGESAVVPKSATHMVVSSSNNYIIKVVADVLEYKADDYYPIESTVDKVDYPLSFFNNRFINWRTKEISNYTGYAYAVVPLNDLGQDIEVDFGHQGSSVSHISYYKSSVINAQNFIAQKAIGEFGGNAQVNNVSVNKVIGATHLVVCSRNDFDIALRHRTRKVSDSNVLEFDRSLILANKMNLNALTNPFPNDVGSIIKRSYLENHLAESHAFIQVYGQSNSDGRIDYADAPQWFTDLNGRMENFLMYNRESNAFEPYEQGVNTGADDNDTTRHGYEIYFAKAWLDANPNKKLYCYKKTVGGTPINANIGGTTRTRSWNVETENIPSDKRKLCSEVIEEVAKIKELGFNFNPIGILYHQGESDADLGTASVALYENNFKNLMYWLRSLFLCHNVKFINGEIVSGYSSNYDAINAIFNNLNITDNKFITVDMSTQSTYDTVHFDQSSIEYLGTQMFNNL